MDYKLTILMPLYNREDYISEAIDSVLAQKTDFKFNLIIIDDASTDGSLKIAQSYEKMYPDIIQIIRNKENLKLIKTIIKGYEHTKADYFCVIDPDDYWIDEFKLQKAVDFLDKNTEFTIYATNTYLLDEDNKKSIYVNFDGKEIDSDFNDYLNGKAILGCSLGGVFRNVIFKDGVPSKLYKIVDSKYANALRGDSFRNIIHLKEGKAHFVNEADSIYRLHSDGIWTKLTKFKRELMFAKLCLGSYYYFDKVNPEFFLEEQWANSLKSAIRLIKTESDFAEIKEDVIDMLEVVLNMQLERQEYVKKQSNGRITQNN